MNLTLLHAPSDVEIGHLEAEHVPREGEEIWDKRKDGVVLWRVERVQHVVSRQGGLYAHVFVEPVSDDAEDLLREYGWEQP